MKPNNAFSCPGDPAGNFMAQDQRRTLDAIPLHDITATDGTGEDLHQKFTRADPGNLHFLKPHIPVIVIHSHTHKLATLDDISFFCSLAGSDTIVQVLTRYNLLLPLLHLYKHCPKHPPHTELFYEEKVVFARSLWYIAFFGPS
jgi:hypothetical protein